MKTYSAYITSGLPNVIAGCTGIDTDSIDELYDYLRQKRQARIDHNVTIAVQVRYDDRTPILLKIDYAKGRDIKSWCPFDHELLARAAVMVASGETAEQLLAAIESTNSV